MNKFEFLDLIDEAVLVLNSKNEILFKNKSCKRKFGDFSNIERIKKYFNFDICVLNPDNIQKTTPLDLLTSSKENFFCFCNYQKTKDEYLYINLYSIKYKKFTVIIFKDVTSNVSFERARNENIKIENKNSELKKELQTFSVLRKNAQEHSLKMAVLNKIGTVIRESTELSEIINSAISEINNLVGATKTYYAQCVGNKLKIKYMQTSNEDDLMNTTVLIDNEALENIKNNVIHMTSCIKESTDTQKTLPKGTKRLIIPIYYKTKQQGCIVSFTSQKIKLNENADIFYAIATQLGSAIFQSSLIDELNKKNKKLEKTLKQLKETQLQLINSEKLASVGQLVAGVAHEINTPVASINSNNEIISRLLNNKTELASKHLEMIKELNNIDKEAISRISNIVISLKRFVHLDEATYQNADINSELDTTLKLITHETKNKINIIKQYGELPTIKCYINMLNQVFMNILINACHSFNDIERAERHIIITTEYSENFVKIKFKDNGKGIPQSVQKRIFEAGFTTKGIGIGTGLGLAICERIVKLHKGTISFSSKENEGSEFVVSVPIS